MKETTNLQRITDRLNEFEHASVSNEAKFLPTRQSLLSRLKEWDDQKSWKVFFETYWRLIYGVATKAGLSDAEAQDVVQETIISVAKKMKEFRYDPALGSFKGWLRQITQRRIADHFRQRSRSPSSSAAELDPQILEDDGGFSLENLWDEEWERNLIDAALRRAKLRVSERQYQIFDCYVVRGRTVLQACKELRVSVAQVYLAKLRVGMVVKRELAALKKEAES